MKGNINRHTRRKLRALPADVKGYLAMRFGDNPHEWAEWADFYEWNHDEMIRMVNQNEDKPD